MHFETYFKTHEELGVFKMFLIKKACLRYDALSSTDSSKSIEKILSDILQYFFTKKKLQNS